jgi:hypothetical protein
MNVPGAFEEIFAVFDQQSLVSGRQKVAISLMPTIEELDVFAEQILEMLGETCLRRLA